MSPHSSTPHPHDLLLPALLAAAMALGAVAFVVVTATTGWLLGGNPLRERSPAAPTVQHLSAPLTAAVVDDARRGRAERAREAAARHHAALHRLAVDPRWEEPAQRDALAGAMRESVRAMVRYRDEAQSLELAQIAPERR